MTDDVIERYDNFNTEGFPKNVFGDFNHQPIPSTYSYLTNDYDDNGTPTNNAIVDNEVAEDSVAPKDEKKTTTALLQTLTHPKQNSLN